MSYEIGVATSMWVLKFGTDMDTPLAASWLLTESIHWIIMEETDKSSEGGGSSADGQRSGANLEAGWSVLGGIKRNTLAVSQRRTSLNKDEQG